MRSEDGRGFTLIELLVVILIIAIMAAIAVPIFLRQRQKAWLAQLQASLKNAASASESYAAGTGAGGYTKPNTGQTFTLSDLQAEGFRTTTPEIVIVSVRGSRTRFCIQAHHARLGSAKPMAIASDVTVPSKGRCNATNFQSTDW